VTHGKQFQQELDLTERFIVRELSEPVHTGCEASHELHAMT
jgi:hypothetical protein